MAHKITAQQRQAILNFVAVVTTFIVDKAADAGPLGAPSGPIYAELNALGCSLSIYNEIVETLVVEGKIEVRQHCLHLTKSEESRRANR